MDYRYNQYYPPVDNHIFGEPNTINYGTFPSQMAPRHYSSYENQFSHSTSMNNDYFDGPPNPHNYGSFLSQREIIITSQYQESEGSPKSKRYRSKSRSPHKFFHDKRKRNKRSRSHEHKSRSVEIKKGSPHHKDDYYPFSNKHQSDSSSTHNNKFSHKQDWTNYDSSSKLSIQVTANQRLENSSSKNRYLPKSNNAISQNLGQSQNSPNSSLESSPLDNEPGYYVNYPSTKKNLVIENPFSGALYLQNIQNRDDIGSTSAIPQFTSDTSASAKGAGDNYEKQDMLMQRSDGHREDFSQSVHSTPHVKKTLSVVSVSSGSENLDIGFNSYNNHNKQIFPQHNQPSFSGNLIPLGQGDINEHSHSFSSREKYIPMENVTSTSHSVISPRNPMGLKGQARGNFMDENSRGSHDITHSISDHNKDSVLPDFNSDTSKLTPEQWINVIEEMSIRKGWNDDDKRYMMTSRLKGLASKWYLSKGITYKKWATLKDMFICAFPIEIEYYCLLKRMIMRKKEEDESIANYFHHKVALLNACEIYGQRAVSCIIYGIPNDKIVQDAKLYNFNNIDNLYSFLRTCYSELKAIEEDKNTRSTVEKHVTTEVSKFKAIKTESLKAKAVKTEIIRTTGMKIKTVKVSKSYNGNRCFRCGSPSHWKSSCKNTPKLCCARCGRNNVMTKHCDC